MCLSGSLRAQKFNHYRKPQLYSGNRFEKDDTLQLSSLTIFEPAFVTWFTSSLGRDGGGGEGPAATCWTSGVVRSRRSRRLGGCRARWPRFTRHREHRRAARG